MKYSLPQWSKSFLNAPWIMVFIFSSLGLIGILRHSMWRDEMNTWLIVRDSHSFLELVGNVHYQGHPILWAVSLALFRNIADTPFVMQLFHLILAISSVSIFWFFSPFNRIQRVLFIFGYLPFYKYLLFSRNYALGMLFLFAFCTFFNQRRKQYIVLSILLGLMANSNAYALFISSALLLTLLIEFCLDAKHRKQYLAQSKKYDLPASLLILLLCYLLALYIIIPPGDSYNHGGLVSGWFTHFNQRRLFVTVGRLFAGYTLITPTSKRWLDLYFCGFIALFIFGLTVLKLSPKKLPLFFYVTATFEILAFTYFRFLGIGPRHFGHFYLILLSSLWIANYFEEENSFLDRIPLHQNLLFLTQKWHHIILMILLYIQFFGGIACFVGDVIKPFSASRETAHYIQEKQLDKEFIVASRDANMAALSGYLNRKFYYPERQDMGSFTLFKEGRNDVKQDEILRQISALFHVQADRDRTLLILSKKELSESRDDLQITPIKTFENAWTDTETYYLYWAQRKPV